MTAGFGDVVEGCQGGELGQLALVEFVGVLSGGLEDRRGERTERGGDKKDREGRENVLLADHCDKAFRAGGGKRSGETITQLASFIDGKDGWLR